MDGANNKRSLTLEISLDAVKISFFPWWFIRWGSATKKNSAWCLDALLTPYVFFLFESYCSREEYYQNDYHLADWTLSLSFVVKTEQASYEHEFVKDAKRDKANNRSIIQSTVRLLRKADWRYLQPLEEVLAWFWFALCGFLCAFLELCLPSLFCFFEGLHGTQKSFLFRSPTSSQRVEETINTCVQRGFRFSVCI